MFDLGSEFNSFYSNEVVLSSAAQSSLYEKKNLNIKRLKEGLLEYNEENDTAYKIGSTITQGSIAMHTAVQNDENDYDIDVGIVFDGKCIGDVGSIAIKHVIADALGRKCRGFKKEPGVKVNCVRIEYSEGYHIDFAIYKKNEGEDGSDSFQHAGSSWQNRDPGAINKWFRDEVKEKGQILRKVIRLLKMFCRSRSDWQMPGGLVLSVLCDEMDLSPYSRLDEAFYWCIVGIRNRLKWDKDVRNPTDASLSLILVDKHEKEVDNLYNRLDSYLQKLEVLFDPECTKEQACSAWADFFNHEYWTIDDSSTMIESYGASARRLKASNAKPFTDNEEYIEDYFPVCISETVEILAEAKRDGFLKHPLQYFMEMRHGWVPRNLELTFSIDGNKVLPSDKVWWKVKNVGDVAIERDDVRGQLIKKERLVHTEHSSFRGPHYVECYLIRDGVCIAMDHLAVPIKD